MRMRINETKAPKVQVQIVTYNSAEHLRECLECVIAQTYSNLDVIVIDNASLDKSIEVVKLFEPGVTVIQLANNTGYTGGHNIGFQRAFENGVDYVLTLNPDVELSPDYIECLVDTLSRDSSYAGVSGKLLRPKNINGQSVIDSAGLQMEGFMHVRDRGSGKSDGPDYACSINVWGICGAAAMYRTEMLRDIDIGQGAFDQTFFVYKEDVDLAWRANRRGWAFRYEAKAVALHLRGWVSRASVSDEAVAHSFANQIALVIRHAPTFAAMVVLSLVVEVLRLLFLSVFRPIIVLKAVQYIRSSWGHHWDYRSTLRHLDQVKESTLYDFCRPGYL